MTMGSNKRWFHHLLDFVAPYGCLACDTPIAPSVIIDPYFCEACAPLLELHDRSPRDLNSDAAVYVYKGPLADALRRMKFEGRRDLAPRLGKLLASHCVGYTGKVDRVMPVPLHPARLRERGFNQSALIAREVANALHLTFDTRSLRRNRYTLPQLRQSAADRENNIKDAFILRPSTSKAFALGSVLLIDDVSTTGATLRAARKTLVDAGVSNVLTLALAQTTLADEMPDISSHD